MLNLPFNTVERIRGAPLGGPRATLRLSTKSGSGNDAPPTTAPSEMQTARNK